MEESAAMSVRKVLAGLALGSALIAGPAMAAEGPYTQAQLDKGKQEYNGNCRQCHAKEGAGALGPALQAVGVTKGYYLFNAAPYALTLLIMVLSSSATRTSADQPAELTVAR